jgi:drug/metabolite transporter (DMT)-like permease
MIFLLLVSLLWAFSFGLIKGGLVGIPSPWVALIRLAIAGALFVPLLRVRGLRPADALRLLLTGAVQYGLMYIAYIQAFASLKAYEAALFTVFTPFYVTAIHDCFDRRWNRAALAGVALAVAGGLLIEYRGLQSPELWKGFALMQLSNLCFAFGQVFYRRTMAQLPVPRTDLQVFGLLYLGAALTAALAAALTLRAVPDISLKQAGILLYLGTVASGVGFWLWNRGARQVGAGTLAVFNNLKIPLGILVSVVCFGETTSWPRLLGGGALMALALAVNRPANPQRKKAEPSLTRHTS